MKRGFTIKTTHGDFTYPAGSGWEFIEEGKLKVETSNGVVTMYAPGYWLSYTIHEDEGGSE